jgi:Ca2+-binding RTX toxin-like protein
VTGSVHIDIFYGDDGENEFRGLGGYDVFYGSAGGRERYDGGNGSDTVSYLFSDAGVVANLARGFGSGGDAARDLYTSIENLGGTNFDDLLLGDEGRNNLRGLSGDDFLFGAGGIDRIFGGRGDDTIDGGDGSDFILYRGDRADFDIEREAGTRNATVTWTGSGAGDGTDTLTNVEYFVFDDETVNIWSL